MPAGGGTAPGPVGSLTGRGDGGDPGVPADRSGSGGVCKLGRVALVAWVVVGKRLVP